MSNSNDISQIRNLIFGETIQQLEERFTKLESELKKTNTRIDELKASLATETQSRQKDVETLTKKTEDIAVQIKQMHSEIRDNISQLEMNKTARQDLSRMFSELSEQLAGNANK